MGQRAAPLATRSSLRACDPAKVSAAIGQDET